MEKSQQKQQVLLVGNPNVGKSTIFNSLCNRKQKTGNYAGVTVASHSGDYVYKNQEVEVIDLPGSYSIYPSAEDEAICTKFLLDERENYNGVIYILDALNLKRGLLMFQQIRDLGIPVLMVVNQLDEAERRGINIDFDQLSRELDVKIVATNAKQKIGIDDLREAVHNQEFSVASENTFQIPLEQRAIVHRIAEKTEDKNPYKVWTLLSSDGYLGKIHSVHEKLNEEEAKCVVPKRLQTQETIRRYQHIDKIVQKVSAKKPGTKELLTEKLDKVLVHKFWGYVVFLAVLLLIFQVVFFMAEYPMNWIDGAFATLADYTRESLPDGPLSSLLADGIIPGLGGIIIFAPQIGILLYFLYLLEDSGYMTRVIFLMDRLLHPFGLNGKSIVPLISGIACSIPAIMSTRNIENVKERLITIMVTPFMTCAARLPVYSIIIALVIPDGNFLGIDYRAIALLVMYLLGFVAALAGSVVLKYFIRQKERSFLVMDLPPYKMPLFGYDFKLMLGRVWDFITGAGKVIFAVSIILWVLSYLGPKQSPEQFIATDVHMDDSYLAKLGKGIEPVVAPLGYDWKMGVAIISSFAAREVFVGTLSTLYSLDEDVEEERIIDKMRNDVKPNGEKVFTLATGLSILVYYAFAMQCISTIAVVYRETRSWKWTLIQLVGMSGLAYIAAFVVYQLFK
ncbi:ferrous iron transport protein B [Chryseobacterium sp. MFBS3-17]|uniref:ferrous iron transport protein B n=1 Tax=Chryseobacterium sp. MFBS3-17 TaxID=2886689 RepID=UPI001D0EE1E6|nr:ferrous iron transport protein B [Chryseobacterium sp. MFBS3-17]MCC2590443.1 ferrous iron transport protein B [Chryseobacterium sp. MFBS3-17]